ncbi:MAG: sugar phosphate isomerase/epimerase [Trueperaceae bacterium]|nr:sugar phosphate isomerase/epimerase [Trueperaceae bacterium]
MNTTPDIRIANAPCSWGLIGEGDAGIDHARMLDELVDTGYQGTELGDYGFMPTDPAQLREALDARGLTMLGGFQGVNLRDRDAVREARQRVLAVTRLLAAVADPARPPLFVLADDNGRDPAREREAGRVTPALGLDRDAWRTFTGNAEEIARIVQGETGLATVFHPHCAGFVETPEETARLLEDTDPDLLSLVFDTGHYVYGTGAPDPEGDAALRGLQRFWDRTRYVHVKDCSDALARRARSDGWDYTTAVRHGLFCELGQGSVDFAAVTEFLRTRGYADWITVEQDVLPGMGTPKDSARRNREYLKGLGL